MRNSIILLVVAGFAMFLYTAFSQYKVPEVPNATASYYLSNEPSELGAANVVTAIVVTYRGLDTLGEVTVLFLTATIIGFMLSHSLPSNQPVKIPSTSEILITASRVLIPGSIILGIYVFINGHLTPGGGFQGGAIIGTAIALMLLADPTKQLSKSLMHGVESLSGIFYVFIGLAGLIWAGGFLDTRFLPQGEMGQLFSAGAMPIIYSLIGLKVGAEISNIVSGVHQTEA